MVKIHYKSQCKCEKCHVLISVLSDFTSPKGNIIYQYKSNIRCKKNGKKLIFLSGQSWYNHTAEMTIFDQKIYKKLKITMRTNKTILPKREHKSNTFILLLMQLIWSFVEYPFWTTHVIFDDDLEICLFAFQSAFESNWRIFTTWDVLDVIVGGVTPILSDIWTHVLNRFKTVGFQ